jgi:hypothetical protein
MLILVLLLLKESWSLGDESLSLPVLAPGDALASTSAHLLQLLIMAALEVEEGLTRAQAALAGALKGSGGGGKGLISMVELQELMKGLKQLERAVQVRV